MVTVATTETTQKRVVVRCDALLERVTFGLRDPPGSDGRIDAVAKGLLQRVAQLARRNSQLLRCVVDDGLALAARRTVLGRGNRDAASRRSKHGHGSDN